MTVLFLFCLGFETIVTIVAVVSLCQLVWQFGHCDRWIIITIWSLWHSNHDNSLIIVTVQCFYFDHCDSRIIMICPAGLFDHCDSLFLVAIPSLSLTFLTSQADTCFPIHVVLEFYNKALSIILVYFLLHMQSVEVPL